MYVSHVRLLVPLLLIGACADVALAQRERMRQMPRGTTTVSESQASELTLTVTDVSVRPIQIWVRTAGAIDAARGIVTAVVPGSQRSLVKVGQRVRAFSPQSRSRMYQATVSQVVPQKDRVTVTASLMGKALDESRHFILEIVTENGDLLSVPNEAVIESGGVALAYVLQPDGSYAPREVTLGIRGELYSQVVDGLESGEQVVTIGSCFIDAERKLKGS